MAMTGSELKRFRVSMGLSQEKFGEELGFANPQIQISQFENGKRPVTKRLEKTILRWKEARKIERRLEAGRSS